MPYIEKGEEIMSDRSEYIGLARGPIPVTVVGADYGDEGAPDFYTVRIKRREWVVWGRALRWTEAEIAGLFGPELAEPIEAAEWAGDDDMP